MVENPNWREADLLANYKHDRGIELGSRVGEAVRALAFHQCVPGSIPGAGVISGLSLLVLYSAPKGFSPGTPVFPLLKNQHLI